MKILYCAPEANNPNHYAYHNIRASFLALGFTLVDFDYLAEIQIQGKDLAITALEDLIESERPDLFYHAIIEDELPVSFLERLKARPDLTTMVFFSDDDRRLEHSLRWVGHYDLATTNDPHAIEKYREAGHNHVRHVQYAANPDFFWPRPVAKRYDVTFVGQAYSGRPEMVRNLLAAGIDVRVWGSGWEQYPDLRAIAGGQLPTALMIETFCASKIVLSFSWCSNWPGNGPFQPQIKGRTFEYPACGAFQICLEDDRLPLYFDTCREIATFKDTDDLIAQIRHYLAHDDEREAMAQAALARTLRDHTWIARWRAFFEDVAERPVPGKEPLALPVPAPKAQIASAAPPPPTVSVLVYVFNIAEYLPAMIDSILTQTYRDFELIIVDDGSTDDTAKLVARYDDPRVHYFYQDNVGKSGRFDLLIASAMQRARGELIAFIGGDDICMPERLERQVALFDVDRDLDVLFTNGHKMDPEGMRIPGGFDLVHPFNGWTLTRHLLFYNLVAHPTVMMRRRCWDRVGPFEQGFAADYHYWLKSARFLKYRYLDEKLISYRIHPKSASTSKDGGRTANLEAIRLVRLIRDTVTIRDLYPEIDHCQDLDMAIAAAYSDLGNRFMTEGFRDVGLAAAEYQRAMEHLKTPDAALTHNLAWAAYLLGEVEGAKALMHAVIGMGLDAAHRSLALMQQGHRGNVPIASTGHLSQELADVVPPYGTKIYDHTGALLDEPYRLLLIADWDADRWIEHLMAFARAFRAGERLELIMPTQGRDTDALAGRILTALEANDFDPETLPDIELREILDLEALRESCEDVLCDDQPAPAPDVLRDEWRHYLPSRVRRRRARLPSVELEGARGFNLVVLELDLAAIGRAVEAYLGVFREGDDVALHVVSSLDPEMVQVKVLAVLEASKADLAHIPDICLMGVAVEPAEWPSYAASADLVVASGPVARAARDTGRPVLGVEDAALWRKALAVAPSIRWDGPALNLTDWSRQRWVLLEPTAWKEALAAYLATKELPEGTTLVLPVEPSHSEALKESIYSWLKQFEHDSERISNVILLEAPAGSEVPLARLATAVVARIGSREAWIATALGVPLASAIRLEN